MVQIRLNDDSQDEGISERWIFYDILLRSSGATEGLFVTIPDSHGVFASGGRCFKLCHVNTGYQGTLETPL